jgi:hypothetical protein
VNRSRMADGILTDKRDLKRALPAQVSLFSVLLYEMENLTVILILLTLLCERFSKWILKIIING